MALYDPDWEDVQRIAKGDAAAARRLVDAHGDRLMAVAFRLLRDREAAEDVVQDAFMRVWQRAGDWVPGQAKFSTWLHRVVVNLCYDRLRKASARYEYAAGDELPEQVDEAPDAEARLVLGEAGSAMARALDRLPPRQKLALVLCVYEEQPQAAAAEIMEISVEALESLLARARRALKQDAELRREILGEEVV